MLRRKDKLLFQAFSYFIFAETVLYSVKGNGVVNSVWQKIGKYSVLLAGLIGCGLSDGVIAAPVTEDAGVSSLGGSDDVAIFGGVRWWGARWEVPVTDLVLDPSGTLLRTVARTELSDTKFVTMPVLGVRYGDWTASFTYFPETSFDSNGALTKDVKRKEYDFTVSYSVLPTVSLSIGYKHADIDRFSNLVEGGYKIDGLLFGGSVNLPLSDRVSLYGNLGYGLARESVDVPLVNGKKKIDGEYKISEIGLSYRLTDGRSGGFVKSATASIGYRAQDFITQNLPEATYSPLAPTVPLSISEKDIRSSTNGFVFAVLVAF